MSGKPVVETLPEPEAGYAPQWDERFRCDPLPELATADWPKLSIVTPSFNQGRFIERTIRCILLQGYPNLEYIVIDGGSTDNSVEIIQKYEPWLAYWTSEPDSGMYEAVNKGFARSTGEIMAWSPTGDLYESGALRVVGLVFRQLPEVEWLTSLWKVKCDEMGKETARYRVEGFCRGSFQKGLNFTDGCPGARFTIAQQSTFWNRALWDRAGGRMDESMQGAGDFELWARFFRHAEIHALDRPLGWFMSHDGQESVANAERMHAEKLRAFRTHGGKCMGRLEGWVRRRVLRRRPFRWLRRIPFCGFQSRRIVWNETSQSATISPEWFV